MVFGLSSELKFNINSTQKYVNLEMLFPANLLASITGEWFQCIIGLNFGPLLSVEPNEKWQLWNV